MAYDDKPHSAAFGTRYGDQSGWERLVEADMWDGSACITMQGSTLHFNAEDLEWLEGAIRTVRYAIAKPKSA